MEEIAGPVAWGHLAQIQMGIFQGFFFKFVHIFYLGISTNTMPLHIKVSCCKEFGELVPLIEGSCFLDFVHQCLWHYLSGFVVARVVVENLWVRCPMFVELGRELYKIA